MKIKVLHQPFTERAQRDLAGHSFLVKSHAANKVLLGKLRFNHDPSPLIYEDGERPIGWGYDVTNGKMDGVVFYRSCEVDVLCMVFEELDGRL